MKCVRNQYVVLKSLALNTDEINTDYENIVNIVEDVREVAWADEMATSCDPEVNPIDAIKNVESNVSLMKTCTGIVLKYNCLCFCKISFVV